MTVFYRKFSFSIAVLVLCFGPVMAQPANDDPCSATILTPAYNACNSTTGDNTGATDSSVPTLTGCDGDGSADLWYKCVVPASGHLIFDTQTGGLLDLGMAIYASSGCNNLTYIDCAGTGSSSGADMPLIDQSGLIPGDTIYIRVWEPNGFQGTFGICVTIPCSLTVNISGPSSSCSNSNPQLCAPAGLTSYSWSTGASTQCINPPSSASYSVTVTDANGCTASDSHSITILPSPVLTITAPDSTCSGSPAQMCVSGSGNPSYVWNTSSTSNCITPSSSGTYTVIGTSGNGCTASQSASIIVYTSPTVSITGNSSACSGANLQLCATSGVFTYLWNNSSTSPCINAGSTGTYTVTITDVHGCTASSSKSVTIFSPVSVSINGPTTACSNDNIQLCTNIPFNSYSWSTGGTAQCINPSASGTYSVTVTDGNGCTGSASTSLTVNTSPIPSITGPTSECSNANAQLCLNSSYPSIFWSNLSTGQCINAISSGTYTATVTDANGCTASATHAITIYPSPSVSINGQTQVCPGTTVLLCATGSSGNYLWSDSSTTTCITTHKDTTFTVTVTDANNCTASASHTVTYFTLPDSTITGATAACFGNTVQLCAPAGMTAYHWNDNSTTQCITAANTGTYTVTVTDANGCTASSSHQVTIAASLNLSILGPAGKCPGTSPTLCASVAGTTQWSTGATTQCITPTSTGTYTVTVTDGSGCSGSASKSFTVYPAFSATITGPSTACYNSNPSLCAPNGTGYHYAWSSGDTTRCITANTSGIYTVTITNSNGCTASDSQGLTIFSPLNATISGPTSLCIGAVANLCAPTGSTSYFWSTGSTSRCVNVNSSGTYSVTITDANNCTASSSITVTFASSITTTITGPHEVCSGSTAELCVPSGYASYAWSNGSTSECINVSSGGIYAVTIHDAVGCVANDTQLVTVRQNPSVFISGLLNICPGDSTDLCATSGFASYLWQDSTTDRCLTVNTSGNYSVTVTDSSGCSASASAMINVASINPTITQTLSGLVCSPTGLQYLYTWYFNDTLFTGCTGDTCTPNHTGYYKVVVVDQLSNCSDSAVIYYDAVGISEAAEGSLIKVYPNPVSGDKLMVDFNQSIHERGVITLYDETGRLITSVPFEANDASLKEIDMSDVKAGVYFLSVMPGNYVRRVVKMD